MYKILTTNRFEKSLKLCQKRNYDLNLLKVVIDILASSGKLPAKYKPHKLSGNFKNCWECHIKPDWLLVWQQNDEELVLLFMDTGTHSDLFQLLKKIIHFPNKIQTKIINLFAQQSKLFEKLLGSNFYQSDQGFLFEDVIISDLILPFE